jgi:hypothetical protein
MIFLTGVSKFDINNYESGEEIIDFLLFFIDKTWNLTYNNNVNKDKESRY